MSITADVGDLQTGSVSALVCADQSINCRVTLATPSCGGGGAAVALYELRRAKLDSQNFSTNINGNETVTVSWSAPIGNSTTLTDGIFLSGVLS